MPDEPKPSIFISHATEDGTIAHAIQDAVQALFGEAVAMRYSTSKELETGIKPGEDWFRWIGQQVREVKVALVLLTPTSVQKPWVLWEGGAVAGAALASEGAEHRKLRTISYKLRGAEIPAPFAREQITDGLAAADIDRLLEDLVRQFASPDRHFKIGQKVEATRNAYLQRVTEALRTAPLLVTEAAVQEWLERIAAFETQGRFSETDELHDWLNLAFGRGDGSHERPLDLRIHRRLGELYARGRMAERAAREFELARQLAPRDVYILRSLGKAYLDQKNTTKAREVIDVITELDSNAFVRNAENAALKARWHRQQGDALGAITVLKARLARDATPYYLWDLLGQAYVAAGQIEEARGTYRQVLVLLDRLRERNVWTCASGFTAGLVLGDQARMETYLRALKEIALTPEEAESVQRGVKEVAKGIDADRDALVGLYEALDLQAGEP